MYLNMALSGRHSLNSKFSQTGFRPRQESPIFNTQLETDGFMSFPRTLIFPLDFMFTHMLQILPHLGQHFPTSIQKSSINQIYFCLFLLSFHTPLTCSPHSAVFFLILVLLAFFFFFCVSPAFISPILCFSLFTFASFLCLCSDFPSYTPHSICFSSFFFFFLRLRQMKNRNHLTKNTHAQTHL